MDEKNKKTVKMILWQEAIDKANELKDWMAVSTNAQVVANCIGIVHYIYKICRNGGNVYIKDSDGRVELIEFETDEE